MTRRRWMPLLALPVVAAVAAAVLYEPPAVYAGHYTATWEVMRFSPCGSGEAWWVADAGGLTARSRPVLGRDGAGTVFVRVRGRVSGPGRFGHLGRYPRAISVKDVVEVRAPAPGDCGTRA